MAVLEWLQFIGDCLLFIGDVVGLTINVIWAIAELLISFIQFIVSIIALMSPYTNLVPFLAMGLTMFILYVVKAVFGR